MEVQHANDDLGVLVDWKSVAQPSWHGHQIADVGDVDPLADARRLIPQPVDRLRF